VSRAVNLLLGMIAILIAANVERMGELYTVTNKLLGAFFGSLCGVFLLGMFSNRANGKGVVLGALVGLAASCFLSFFSELTVLHESLRSLVGSSIVGVLSDLSWQWPPVVGLISTLLVGALASRLGTGTTDAAPLTYYRVVNSNTPVANRDKRPN
jgi:Na+/proline symporter